MTNRFPAFSEDETVASAIGKFSRMVRARAYDTSHHIYVVDSEGRLKGVIGIGELLMLPEGKLLGEVAKPPQVTVTPETGQAQVARLIARYDLLELPVVDGGNRLLGVVTVDDAVDVLIGEGAGRLEKFGGLARRITTPYLAAGILELVKKRAVWLIALAVMETVTATILSTFERVISAVVALAFFIPLIDDIGGNAGSQTASFIIRALATGDVTTYDVFKVLAKESLTSVVLGIVLSPVIFGVGMALTWNLRIAVLLAIAVVAVVFVTSMIGGLLPLFSAKIGIDPATISAPLITTMGDIVGLTLYFFLAMTIFGIA